MIPVVAVVGPTASGKTSLAIALAEQLGTEIISADSMQFYRDFEIGSAAPTPEQRARVRHHFVCAMSPDTVMAAGRFQALARPVVELLNERGKPAIVVGGSGLYITALLDGLFEGPPRSPELRAALREEARRLGNAHLMNRLREVDPTYAALLTNENDVVRVVRALEVFTLTGQPLSQLHAEFRRHCRSLPALRVGLAWERSRLYERITYRVEDMIAAGWCDEVRNLVAQGYRNEFDRLKILGYRDLANVLEGAATLPETLFAIKQQHRRYAKRQIAWFSGDRRVQWIQISEESSMEDIARGIVRRAESF